MEPLSEWLEEWVLDLKAGRPGDTTIMIYRRTVTHFLRWLADAHPDVVEPAQLDRKMVRSWVLHRIGTGHQDATRRRDGIALRKFLKYVAEQPDSGLDANPAADIDLPTATAPVVPIVPDLDLATLLKSMTSNDFIDRRDTAIIRLLFDSGIRRAELCAIDTDDLDLQQQQVLVHGKGSKDRIVPFGNKTTLAIRKYQRARAARPAADARALFLSRRPDPLGEWRLTGGGVGEMVTRRCAAAGLSHLHPHQFRHTWAADLKGQGISDADLERLAGWTTPLMSRRYGAIVADEQARAAARRLSRGDRV